MKALQYHSDLEGVDYDLLIVDEYQDLNACDLSILRQIAGRGCSIIAAGDPDQSIYSFRRAAPEGILRFPSDYPECGNYPLSVTQRCGSRIVDWATYVIEGDPGRPASRPRLRGADDAPPGEVALLHFRNETAEASGVADLARYLTEHERVPPNEILVLLRSDHNGAFSAPIKEALTAVGITYSDPEVVERMLGEEQNRRMLATFRLLVNPEDSLAWATLLHLSPNVGPAMTEYIYNRARDMHVQFGHALVGSHADHFPEGPRSSPTAGRLIQCVRAWLNEHPLPEEPPSDGWGHWMAEIAGGPVVAAPTAALAAMLQTLDGLVELDQDFGRYLSQITPLGRDRAIAESQGVRIMTMNSAKGLTVRATIIVGLEGEILPRPESDQQEERRLLYVAMTRAKEYLFGTWALRRRGPTARAGAASVAVRRNLTNFLRDGPVRSLPGEDYLRAHGGGH